MKTIEQVMERYEKLNAIFDYYTCYITILADKEGIPMDPSYGRATEAELNQCREEIERDYSIRLKRPESYYEAGSEWQLQFDYLEILEWLLDVDKGKIKTKKRVVKRLEEAVDKADYYRSYLPEYADKERLECEVQPECLAEDEECVFRIDPVTLAELIVRRGQIEEKTGMKPPVDLADAEEEFLKAVAQCAMLEWILDLDTELARDAA